MKWFLMNIISISLYLNIIWALSFLVLHLHLHLHLLLHLYSAKRTGAAQPLRCRRCVFHKHKGLKHSGLLIIIFVSRVGWAARISSSLSLCCPSVSLCIFECIVFRQIGLKILDLSRALWMSWRAQQKGVSKLSMHPRAVSWAAQKILHR